MASARYELLHLLGRGGMGSVYAAVHQPSGRELAVKIPFETSGSAAARRSLLREAAAAARLRHPNIVRLHDVVRLSDGRLALVMELVDGQNLAAWAIDWPGWAPLLSVIDGVLDGLGAAHAAGIVHRDLKLENVLISLEGRAKITDFGVAADLDMRSQGESERMPGGTPLYMAPEQFASNGHVGPWTDLYALGVMLHVLFTGEPPFDESTLPRLLLAKHRGVLSGALERVPLPQELARVIESLLSPDPRRRPRFARELRSIFARLPRDLPPPRAGESAWITDSSGDDSSFPTHISPKAATAPLASELTPSSRKRRIGSAPTEPSASSNPKVVPPTLPSVVEPTLDAITTPYLGAEVDAPLPTERSTTDPTWLPAPLDPELGVSVARLRDPEIVGRTHELDLIREAIVRVSVSGRAELVGVVGASGVGKSTLARWGLSLSESEGLMEPLATAFDAFAAGAGGGIRHAMARLLGDPGSLEEGQSWPSAWGWLGSEAAPPFDARRAIAWLKDDPEPSGPEESAQIAFEILRTAAKVRPIYLWLDDLGWSRDGAIELAEKLLASGDVPILIVATFRSGTLEHASVRHATERLLAFPSVTLRELAKLGRDERAELIRAVAPMRPGLAQALAAALDETTLVTIELIHDWITAGVLQPTPQGFSTDESVEALLERRPPHVALQNRVESFLRAFGTDAELAERVLTRAALLGVVFDEQLLASACSSFDPEGKVVHEVIDRTLLSGILRPEGRINYRFDHNAIREALVLRLERRPDRTAVLDEIIEWLLKRLGYSRPEVLIRIATLLHESDRESLQAWEVLLDATGILARNSEFAVAEGLIDLAARWLEDDRVPEIDWRRARVLHARGRTAFFASRYEDAEPALREAERVCVALNDLVLLNRCILLRAQVLLYRDRLAEAERVVLDLIDGASHGPTRNARQITICHHMLAELASLRGDEEQALSHTLKARVATDEVGEPTQVRMQEIQVVERLLALGRVQEAEARLNACLSQIEASGDRGTAPHALETSFRLSALKAEWSKIRALGITIRAAELEALGDLWRLTGVRVIEALASLHLDEPATAAAVTERFVSAFERAHHDEGFTRIAMRQLAAALQMRGLAALADRVRALSAARDAAIARGFGWA